MEKPGFQSRNRVSELMPILLVLLLTAACLPTDWPNPLGLSLRAAACAASGAVALSLMGAAALRAYVLRGLRRDPAARGEIGRRYDLARRVFFFVNVGLVAIAVAGLGWGHAVWSHFAVEWRGHHVLAPFAELLVIAPYFAIVFGNWLLYYDAEAALVRSARSSEEPLHFWSRIGFFLHHLRQFALLVLMPVVLMVTHRTVTRFYPEAVQADWYRLLSLAAVPLFILFAPLIIKPLLGLRSMPPGPVRSRIEALARRLHFRYSDLLVWPTHGSTMNAMIVGLFPRVRYVIFTDAILDELPPEELDAVFGHEVGHARHGHIWYYAAFLTLSIAAIAGLFLLVGETREVLMLLAAGAYLFVVFGILSRRCERQADIFGCRAVSCADPDCAGHDEATVFPERGAGLCPTGIRTCARALDRVHAMNLPGDHDDGRTSLGTLLRGVMGWLRAWQHAPIPTRIRFLHAIADDRRREARFQRRLTFLRWGLALGLIASVLLLAQAIGWRALLDVM
jgi:Zn-dependent protease with chaperone function